MKKAKNENETMMITLKRDNVALSYGWWEEDIGIRVLR